MNVIVPKKKTNNQKKEDKGSFILRPPEPLNDFHGQDCRRDGRTVQPDCSQRLLIQKNSARFDVSVVAVALASFNQDGEATNSSSKLY
jgi:hypothetical protein